MNNKDFSQNFAKKKCPRSQHLHTFKMSTSRNRHLAFLGQRKVDVVESNMFIASAYSPDKNSPKSARDFSLVV